MTAERFAARMRVFLALTAVAALAVLIAVPAFAIDVYQASPIEEYHADTVEPVQSDTIDQAQAEQVEPYTGDSLSPEQGGSMQQWGLVKFIAPDGWVSAKQDGSYLFVPKGVSRGNFCLIVVMPVETPKVNFFDWFAAESKGKLGAGVRLVDTSAAKEMTTGSGDTMLLATRITEKKSGERMYTSYVAVKHGGRCQIVAYATSSGDLFVKYSPEFEVFMQSLQISQEVNRTDNHAAVEHHNTREPIASGNAVEPLSNGLLLTMTATQITNKFGEPAQDDRFIAGGIGYRDFGAIFNAQGDAIWHFTILKDVTLNCGIGIGSTRQDINAVFGRGTSVYGDTTLVYDQYRLTFYFDNNRVDKIKIDPVNGTFRRYRHIPFGGHSESTSSHSRDNNTNRNETRKGSASTSYAGIWQGIASTVGRIVLHADGTYDMNGHPNCGKYRVSGTDLYFTGTLKSWDNGHGFVKDGSLQFQWTKNSVPYWFTYAKVDR